MTLLRWIPSVAASAVYAASALLAGRTLANPALQEALAEPAANLNRLLRGALSPADGVFSLLIHAAASVDLFAAAGIRDLARLPEINTDAAH